MAKMTAKIVGSERLIAKLRRTNGNVQAGLEPILLAAGEVLRQAAADNVRPISTVTAENMIKETVVRKSGSVEVWVGPQRKKAWYAHLIEFGAKPHRIVPRKAKMLRFINGALRRAANHPGMAARPFMRPAFDNRQAEAKAKAGSGILKALWS